MDPELANMFGLGGPAAAPAETPPAQPTTGGGSDWASYLSDPRGRAALISFGLQAMTGGYGNGIQQLGAALGAGAQGAGGMDKIIYDREQAAKEMAQKGSEGAANRAQSETNARIAADSRNEVAQTRAEASLERMRMGLAGKATPSDALKYRTEARKVYEGNLANMSKPQLERELEIENLAGRMYDADAARRGVRPTGDIGGDAGATSTNPAGGTGVPGTPAQTQTPNATSTTGTVPNLDKLMAGTSPDAERFKKDMSTPEGQAEILRRNPALKDQIDTYNRRQGQTPYLPHNLIRGLFGASPTTP